MHLLFDDYDETGSGVLGEESLRQMLVNEKKFDPAMLRSRHFWRTFASRACGTCGSRLPAPYAVCQALTVPSVLFFVFVFCLFGGVAAGRYHPTFLGEADNALSESNGAEPAHQIHRDAFLVLWHCMLSSQAKETRAKMIDWDGGAGNSSTAREKTFCEEAFTFQQKIHSATTWHMERTVRVLGPSPEGVDKEAAEQQISSKVVDALL
eukprot:SAG11_NODE_4562_length_1850_cov_1.268989_1_plen_207_part_10